MVVMYYQILFTFVYSSQKVHIDNQQHTSQYQRDYIERENILWSMDLFYKINLKSFANVLKMVPQSDERHDIYHSSIIPVCTVRVMKSSASY